MVFRNVFAVADRSLVDVEAVSGTSDHTSNEDAEKRQSQLSNGEAIAFRVHSWDGIEEGVVRAIHERGVEIGHRDSWILEGDLYRSDDGVLQRDCDGLEGDISKT